MGNDGQKDVVFCFDAESGKELWRYAYPMTVDPKYFEGGPRSTPTLDGGHLYTVSHEGDLFCLDAKTGKGIWYKHYQQDFSGRRPDWGYAGAPLAKGGLLYCEVGGAGSSTVALDKNSGRLIWKSGNDQAGYATPLLANLAGRETVVSFKADAVVGYDAAKGEELWRTPWKTQYDVNAASPQVVGADKLWVGSGYNMGCALFQIADHSVTQLWRNKNLRTQINSPAQLEGHLYGIDGDVGGGNLTCLTLSDGNRTWQEKSVKGGALIASNGKLICISEKGELVICDASPEAFHPLLRAQVLNKRCWAQPTLESGRLFLRDNDGNVVCLDLR
jgi:outer membrane protein assembly factor BamB